MNRVLRELARRREPFFLGVGFWKPHTPFNPPQRYWDLYRREEIPPLRNPTPPRGVPALALHSSSEGLMQSDAATLELRHGYYAALSYMNAQLGSDIHGTAGRRAAGRDLGGVRGGCRPNVGLILTGEIGPVPARHATLVRSAPGRANGAANPSAGVPGSS